jgi:hypothetical protein
MKARSLRATYKLIGREKIRNMPLNAGNPVLFRLILGELII